VEAGEPDHDDHDEHDDGDRPSAAVSSVGGGPDRDEERALTLPRGHTQRPRQLLQEY
jgi:hypothetical protein